VRQPYDVREVIARVVDGSRLDEFKARYGPTLVCGFARIWGCPVGIVANNGILFSESAQKGAHFVELCSQRGVRWCSPEHRRLHGGPEVRGGRHRQGRRQARHRRRHHRRARSSPCIIGGSFGAGQLRHVRPRLLAALPVHLPNSRISVMGGEQAASVLATVRRDGIEGRGGAWTAEEEKRLQGADPRAVRGRRATPTTPAPGSGTTG
jgi:3-methylcrotonyl-CoA carboxylase beta subunit